VSAGDGATAGNVRLEPGEVPRIVLDRGAKRNAVNGELAAEFVRLAQQAVDGGAVAVILEADGPVFTAGADMSDLDDGARAVDQVLDCLLDLPIHWVALVRQPVYGAGLAFLAAIPLVVATPAATFTLPELARGFFPTALMPGQARSLGTRQAYDLAFSAGAIDAARAQEAGLVNAVVLEEVLEEHLTRRLAALHRCPRDEVLQGVRSWQDAVRPSLRPPNRPDPDR
jgi:enoyl-CoA hydratase/carnithine racemase